MTFRSLRAAPSRYQTKVSMKNRFGSEKVGTAGTEPEVGQASVYIGPGME